MVVAENIGRGGYGRILKHRREEWQNKEEEKLNHIVKQKETN